MDPITITMTAAELEMRHNGGSRYRLVSMNGWRPPRMGGRWPLITDMDETADGRLEVVVLIESDTDWHGTFPRANVVVIPVNEERATQSTREMRKAVLA